MKNKNIWLLPTDKESRLHFDDKLFLSTSLQISKNINSIVEGRNIYITSEKEIKMGDWYTIEFNGIPITKCISEEELISIEGRNDCKKIILTTDDQLIKDGVQEIDDEFLEWFVKNPSCERVEVEKGFPDGTSYGYNFIDYKIIIPKEEVLLQSSIDGEAIWGEAKQETLEEYFLDNIKNMLQFNNDALAIRFMEKYFEAKCELKTKTLEEKLDKIVSKEPSKFLEESDKRMEAKAKLFRYSEEEVYHILCEHTAELFKGSKMTLTEWFNKVKKK